MEGPVFVEAEKDAAAEKVVAFAERGWPQAGIVAKIEMAETDAPDVVGLEGDGVESHPPIPISQVVASEGLESDPGAGVEGEIGVEVSESALIAARLETPVGVEVPVDEIGNLTVALGLEFIVETQANDILAVDRINGVVVRKLDWEEPEAG